jgi:hypothetical protein
MRFIFILKIILVLIKTLFNKIYSLITSLLCKLGLDIRSIDFMQLISTYYTIVYTDVSYFYQWLLSECFFWKHEIRRMWNRPQHLIYVAVLFIIYFVCTLFYLILIIFFFFYWLYKLYTYDKGIIEELKPNGLDINKLNYQFNVIDCLWAEVVYRSYLVSFAALYTSLSTLVGS